MDGMFTGPQQSTDKNNSNNGYCNGNNIGNDTMDNNKGPIEEPNISPDDQEKEETRRVAQKVLGKQG